MAERILTGTDITLAPGSNTNTQIGQKETFLDRNAKLIPSDETTTAITNMNWIAGHHTVKDLENLYKIPDFILSQSCYADKVSKNGKDAIGQLWYVEDDRIKDVHEKGYYKLVNWDNRNKIETHNTKNPGWSKTNIKSLINEYGGSSTQYLNVNQDPKKQYDEYDNIHSITIDGSDNHTYTGWTQDYKFVPSVDGVKFSYSHYGEREDSSINIPVLTIDPNHPNTNKAGIVTVDQYNSIIERLKNLENRVMWRSGIYIDENGVQNDNGLNKATYLWTGTLGEFNSLKSKPENTTFIISN